MTFYARIASGRVAEPPVSMDPGLFASPANLLVSGPDFFWVAVPDKLAGQVAEGWLYDDKDGFKAPPPPPALDTNRYVPLATVRERLMSMGLWDKFAAAVDGLPAAERWHLLTLREGVAPDDPAAVALLKGVGADPAAVLA